jgi:two-component system, OmpR family, sensor histidine kinase CpxA
VFFRLIPHLSSIKFKLFLWFWLITLCSIVATRFVSEQLSEKFIQLPTHQGDFTLLNDLSLRLNRLDPNNWEEVLSRFYKRQARRSNTHTIWTKNLSTNQVMSSTPNYNNEVSEFIRTTSFSNSVTWQFQRYRLTGPVSVINEQNQFQLFVSRPTKRPPQISMAFMSLPLGARVAIPLTISFLLCWWLARTLSRPIYNIAKVATQVGEGQLSSRVFEEANRKDELGDLARTFNNMASKLEQNISSQQRLLGDVSHELRSPLTRLQMALGLIHTSSNDPKALKKYIDRAELEVSRLDEMIGNVLSLSRLENTLQQLHVEECDLTKLVSMLIEDAKFVAQDKSVCINLHTGSAIMVLADALLLSSALGNIINNAVKYTPDDSIVNVTIESIENKVSIIISDNGAGVPEASLSHLFEPFYRVTEARDRQSGGTGLGLAIARQAIQLHKGTVSAKNKDNGGLEVTVELPQ